jgi:dihydroorotate dehydrogenase subfamily 1
VSDLSITVNGLHFPNPFVIGSGPPSTNARVIIKAFNAGWGGVVAKTCALTENKAINVQPRYGKLKSSGGQVIGFENIELISDRTLEEWEDDFKRVKDEWPDKMLIGSVMESYEKGRWQEVASRVVAAGCDAVELNFSCPHGHPERGMGAAMGQDPQRVETVTRWVADAIDVPIWAKMTPNITDIRIPAAAARRGGASGVSAINTILGCVGINMRTLKPMPTVEGHSTPGGYSYLAVKPIALRFVSEMAIAMPGYDISGIGGVTNSIDAFEHILVGASTVQSCTGPMLQGFDMVSELKDGLEALLEQHGFDSVSDAVGHCLQYFTTHHHLVELQAEKRARQAAAKAAKEAAASIDRDTDWGKGSFQEEVGRLASESE